MELQFAGQQQAAQKEPDPFIVAVLKAGETRKLGGDPVIPLDDVEKVWMVMKGKLELFAIPMADGKATGVQQHLCTIATGEMCMGFPEGFGNVAIEARGGPETSVTCISTENFEKISTEVQFSQSAASVIDHWVEKITEGCVRSIFPKPSISHFLLPEEGLETPEGAVLGSRYDVLWLELPENAAMFANLEPMPLEASILVPLATTSWLTMHQSVTVRGVKTVDVLLAKRWRACQEAFHDAVFSCLPFNISLAEVDEFNRLASRDRRVDVGMANMVNDLASLVGSQKEGLEVVESDEYLFAAASKVIRSIGGKHILPAKARQEEFDVPPTLDEIVRASSMRFRSINLSEKWWTKDMGPLVAHKLESLEAVALLPKKLGGYTIFDPSDGSMKDLNQKRAATLSETAYILFKALPNTKLRLRDVFFFGLDQSGSDVSTYFWASFVIAILGLGFPVASAYVFSVIIPGHLPSLLIQIGAALVLSGASVTLMKTASDIAVLRLDSRVGTRFKAAIWDRILRMPMSFLNRYPAGDFFNRTVSLENFQVTVRSSALIFLSSGSVIITGLAMLFWLNTQVAVIACILLFLLAAMTALFGFLQYRAFKGGESASGIVDAFVLEIITGIVKIRLAGAEERALVNWGERFTKLRSKMIGARKVMNYYTAFMSGFNVLAMLGVFSAVALLSTEEVSVGIFIAFISALTSVTFATMQIAQNVMGLCFQIPAIKYMMPLLDNRPTQVAGRSNPGTLQGEIEINNVFFRYTAETPVILNGINLKVKPGEFLAITGVSGSGKSTLSKLLLALESPQGGCIFFDGKDLRGLDLDAVRRQIGVVMQDCRLMSGTIFENVRGVSDCSLEDVWEAAKIANIAEDIEAMPMGMNTMIASSESTFSGGQVQRLAIARAIAHRPPILIFDEATSALDNTTQAQMVDSLGKLTATRIVIAHRLNTIRHADRIAVLEGGRVAELGTYDELIELDGLFARMVERQVI